jgi:hypothetical protein
VEWKELQKLTPNLMKQLPADMRYRWVLLGWKAVTPTSSFWELSGEPFGRHDVLWIISFVNTLNGDDRQFLVHVEAHLLLENEVYYSGLSFTCSMSLWNKTFVEQKIEMKQLSPCSWDVSHVVNSESRDPLELNVTIHVITTN